MLPLEGGPHLGRGDQAPQKAVEHGADQGPVAEIGVDVVVAVPLVIAPDPFELLQAVEVAFVQLLGPLQRVLDLLTGFVQVHQAPHNHVVFIGGGPLGFPQQLGQGLALQLLHQGFETGAEVFVLAPREGGPLVHDRAVLLFERLDLRVNLVGPRLFALQRFAEGNHPPGTGRLFFQLFQPGDQGLGCQARSLGVGLKPAGGLLQRLVVGPGVFVPADAGHPGVQPAGHRIGPIVRRPVLAVPEVHEELVGLVRLRFFGVLLGDRLGLLGGHPGRILGLAGRFQLLAVPLLLHELPLDHPLDPVDFGGCLGDGLLLGGPPLFGLAEAGLNLGRLPLEQREFFGTPGQQFLHMLLGGVEARDDVAAVQQFQPDAGQLAKLSRLLAAQLQVLFSVPLNLLIGLLHALANLPERAIDRAEGFDAVGHRRSLAERKWALAEGKEAGLKRGRGRKPGPCVTAVGWFRESHESSHPASASGTRVRDTRPPWFQRSGSR